MYQKIGLISLPTYHGDIMVNMMPFIMGDHNSVPEFLQGYLPLIDECKAIEKGKVAYLTVNESIVKEGKTQRRPGAHTEGTGIMAFGAGTEFGSGFGSGNKKGSFGEGSCGRGAFGKGSVSSSTLIQDTGFGAGNSRISSDSPFDRTPSQDNNGFGKGSRITESGNFGAGKPSPYPGFGAGNYGHDLSGYHLQDGIYMASSDGACQMWDEYVPAEEVDKFGGLLNPPKTAAHKLEANTLYWFTDRTPHEPLPSKADSERQFFRVVSNKLGVWWEKHCTANPLGVKPDCRIFTHSKFD